MPDAVTLRTALAPYPHVQPLRTGLLVSEHVILNIEDAPDITRAFRRMVRQLDFDLCEIALTTLAQAIAHGKPLIGLPVVVMRGFHHGALTCPVASSIRTPDDLRGKRVGVRAYSQTTGVWVRGILRDDYGVDHRDITWVTAEDAHVAEYADPPNVHRIGAGKTLAAMLMGGEIDAGIALTGLDRSALRPVIENPDQAAADWYRRTGAYPVNHVVCLKTSLLQQHPWLAAELLRLFVAAKVTATEDSAEARWAGITGDPLPYGLGANHAGLALCLQYAAEQGLVPVQYAPEQVFTV